MVWHGVAELFSTYLLFFFSPFFQIFFFYHRFPFKIICDCYYFVMHRRISCPFHSIPFCAFYRLFCRLKTHFHIQLVSTLIYFLDYFFCRSFVHWFVRPFISFESGYDFNYRLRVWSIKIMTQFICVVTLLVENIVRFFRVR